MKLPILFQEPFQEGEATPQFNIGDIVQVTDFGMVYDTYKTAFDYFKVEKNNPRNFNGYTLWIDSLEQFNILYNINLEGLKWVIKDIAVHADGHSIIYYIVGPFKLALVVDERAIEKCKKRGGK